MTDPVAEMTEDERVEQAKQEHIEALRKEHAQALADHMNHPHAQLAQLVKDLQTAPALDVSGRIGQLNSAVQRLITIVKAHTPEGPPHPGEFNAEGIDAGK